MDDIIAFRFPRRKPLIHAGKIDPDVPGWSAVHVFLRLLCGRPGVVGAWQNDKAATLENVTCPRCRSKLAHMATVHRPPHVGEEGRDG